MRCPNCDFENRPGARFCKQCGQPLEAQDEASGAPGASQGVVCQNCGATAKPEARFCPRCGKPLEEAGAPTPPPDRQPSPQPPPTAAPSPSPAREPASRAVQQPQPAQPSPTARQPSPRQPADYGQPSPSPPPPSPPSSPPSAQAAASGLPIPRWLKWVAGGFAALCLIAIAVMVGRFVFGGEAEPTSTPTPTATSKPAATATMTATKTAPAATPTAKEFSAQVAIKPFTDTVKVGETVTVAITLTNTGNITVSNLRYRVAGKWEPFLILISEDPVRHEGNVLSNASDETVLEFEAAQSGDALLQAYVMMDVHIDPLSTEGLVSEKMVRITVKK